MSGEVKKARWCSVLSSVPPPRRESLCGNNCRLDPHKMENNNVSPQLLYLAPVTTGEYNDIVKSTLEGFRPEYLGWVLAKIIQALSDTSELNPGI